MCGLRQLALLLLQAGVAVLDPALEGRRQQPVGRLPLGLLLVCLLEPLLQRATLELGLVPLPSGVDFIVWLNLLVIFAFLSLSFV